jgi:carboxylesterase
VSFVVFVDSGIAFRKTQATIDPAAQQAHFGPTPTSWRLLAVFGLAMAVARRYSVSVPGDKHRFSRQQPARRRSLWHCLALSLLALPDLSLIGLAALALVPPPAGDLVSRLHPAPNYAEAVNRILALQAQESSGYNPQCVTQSLTHGQKTARAIAFAHGFANGPQIFAQLGQQFYALGYNVLIVPLPHHGLADRLTGDLTHLTAEELVAYADQVVDIVRSLGDRVTMAGLSAGGAATAWAAQTRADLDQAVVIAPGLGLMPIPAPLMVLATNVSRLLPDAFAWWDAALQDRFTPGYTYPRFSGRGLAQVLRAGFAVRSLARRAPPAAGSILVVTNANDNAVDNGALAQVVSDWHAQGCAVAAFEFPADWHLVHDLADPGETGQRIDLAYPKLIALIGS